MDWALAVKWAAVFLVAATCGTDVAKRLLKGFEGLLISDRWCAYCFVPTTRRQLCWAHRLRHWKEFCGYAHPTTKVLGAALKEQTRQMFTRWHQVLAGTLAREQFRVVMEPIRRELERSLVAVMKDGIASAAAKAREIWRERVALFTFVEHLGVDPTNNAAERVIRLAVRWRKNCYGTFSDRGAHFAERMLTDVELPPVWWTPPKARRCARSSPCRGSDGRSLLSSRPRRSSSAGPVTAAWLRSPGTWI